MARRKISRKRSKNAFIKKILQVRFLLIRLVLFFVLCGSVLTGAFYGVRHFFLTSQLFVITEVVVNRDRPYSFRGGEDELNRLYIGRNIFDVDLNQIQLLVKRNSPQLKKIEVRRNPPGRIEVDVVSREPAAIILDSGAGIIVDAEGMVLARDDEARGLVKIKGMRFFASGPSKGQKLTNKILREALVLIEGINRKLEDNKADIEYIDISDRNNILINIGRTVVKMGTSDFSMKLDKLKQILEDPDIDMQDIGYIDLRFRDPVISPR